MTQLYTCSHLPPWLWWWQHRGSCSPCTWSLYRSPHTVRFLSLARRRSSWCRPQTPSSRPAMLKNTNYQESRKRAAGSYCTKNTMNKRPQMCFKRFLPFEAYILWRYISQCSTVGCKLVDDAQGKNNSPVAVLNNYDVWVNILPRLIINF